MFDFINKTAGSLVDVTADILTLETPKRSDVKQLVAAGMTVAAIAVAFDMTEDAVQSLLDDS